jgi:hypothetical protein
LQFKTSPGKEFARPYLEKTLQKKRAGGVAQGVGPEVKSQQSKINNERHRLSEWRA